MPKDTPPQTTIFLCNSPTDGFRSGDGDLMDRLTTELNNMNSSISATRIITTTPPEDIHRPENQLVVLDDLPDWSNESLSHLHSSQQQLVGYIVSSPAPNKILYIGSRIDNYRTAKNSALSISVGSGALLTEDVLIALKKYQVKIVICCLELVFHTRSLVTSFRLYEMLRQHLRYADSIHCLTEQDKYYLEHGLMEQLLSGARLTHPLFPLTTVESYLKEGHLKVPRNKGRLMGDLHAFYKKFFGNSRIKYDRYFTDFPGRTIAEQLLHIPWVYASGVCTVTELPEDCVHIEHLMRRNKNVLIFGLIRTHKGIEEGLELARLLKQQNSDTKVYIIGKIVNITPIIKQIFETTFDSLTLSALDFKEKFHLCLKSKNHNQSIQALYDELISVNSTKQANIELALDVRNEDLLPYIQDCRYAIKLDVKGFAETASSMISTMIGMCLPTIAQYGLVTSKSVDYYSDALCLVDNGLALNNAEVSPSKADVTTILNIIQESEEQYFKRIQAILSLRHNRQFDAKNTADRLMDLVFSPLIQAMDSKIGTEPILVSPTRTSFALFHPAAQNTKANDCSSSAERYFL